MHFFELVHYEFPYLLLTCEEVKMHNLRSCVLKLCSGVYGSRPDSEDVTKRLDELLLDDLLDGSYKCPSLMKDKGKKSSNSSSNLLNSVGEVWSILQKRKAKPQAVETDFGYYRDNMPSCLLNSGPVTLKSETDKGDIDMADLSSSQKVSLTNKPCI